MDFLLPTIPVAVLMIYSIMTRCKKNSVLTPTMHGGVLAGISNGEDLIMRIAIKPPSSIGKKQTTVDIYGKPAEFEIKGRHDPCICPRIVPVAEAMVALVLIDHILMQERISSDRDLDHLRRKVDTIDTQFLLLYAPATESD